MVAAGAKEDKLAPYCFKADEDYYISGTCKIESERLIVFLHLMMGI
jgi:hypothetical protein